MQRVATGSQVSALPAPNAISGTPGFFNNLAPAIGVTPTIPGPDWFNDKQEELAAAVLGLGIALDATKQTLLLQALKRLAGANVTTLVATATLTADNTGLVLVSASAGNVVITLPLANSAGGVPINFRIVRTDSSANTVTVSMQGADTSLLQGVAQSYQVTALGQIELYGDGVSHWTDVAAGGIAVFTTAGATVNGVSITWTNGGNFTFPSNRRAKVISTGGGGGGQACQASANGASGGAGGTAIGYYTVVAGTPYAVMVGAGGNGGTGTGGTTSFGTLCTAAGGGGATSGGVNGSGGSAAGGQLNLTGGDGTDATSGNVYATTNGGASYWGGGSSSGYGVPVATLVYGAGGAGELGTPGTGGNPGGNGIVIVEY